MSALIDRAIAEAGLGELARARQDLDGDRLRALASVLFTADLLAVGALADRIRRDEVGDRVTLFAGACADDDDGDALVVGADDSAQKGRDTVLRRVAFARITGPKGARVRVDWATTGIELAQVALGFGANELVGPVLNRRGLPILAESAKKVKGAGLVSAQLLKKKELAALVRTAGREPVFVDEARRAVPTNRGESLEHA